MQRLTTGVKTQRTLVFCDVDMQADVRIGDGDIRTFTGLLAEEVDNGVLDLVRYEF
jgi:hypothetical protein